MQRLIFIIAACVMVLAVGAAFIDNGRAPPPEHGGETKDRLPEEKLHRLVEGPLKIVERGDMAGGRAAFDASLAKLRKRKGPNSLAEADMLSAFGVELRPLSHEKESIDYLRRAVDAYRAAEGPDSPELAVALHDYARVLYLDRPDEPSPAVILGLREALRIRLAALGPKNAETAVTYVFLGEVEGLPVNTQRERARVDAAEGLIRRGAELLPDAPNGDAGELQSARFHLVEVYARNGLGRETLQAADAYCHPGPCDRIDVLADLLEGAGDASSAGRLRANYGPEPD